jgi:hypothetical protein
MTNKKRIFFLILFVLLLILLKVGIYKFVSNDNNDVNIIENKEQVSENDIPVLISTKDIKEENFSGTRPEISGFSPLVAKAQEYIEQRISEFKAQADIDVPEMRKQFGAESPTSNYTIDINATYIKSEKTESIVISEYVYTGGANGNSSYKVITVSLPEGKVLSLSDVIKKDRQASFVSLVKKELIDWRPVGSTGPVVFEEEVKNLVFDSFKNWSLDNENLVLYFDKYEIGPGVLGPVAFPLPLMIIKDFLEPAFSL